MNKHEIENNEIVILYVDLHEKQIIVGIHRLILQYIYLIYMVLNLILKICVTVFLSFCMHRLCTRVYKDRIAVYQKLYAEVYIFIRIYLI